MTNTEEDSFEYVYGIHEGSISEGGGMGMEVYKDVELALEVAVQIVSKNQQEQNEVYTYEEQMKKLPHQWKLVGEGRWTNGLEEVHVILLRVV